MTHPKYAVLPRPLTLSPHEFLRVERRLFLGLKSSPRPRAIPERIEKYAKISEANARRALAHLLRQFEPGDPVGFRDVQQSSDCSQSHARKIIHRLKEMEAWPFSPPPEMRGRKPLKSP